MSEMLVKGELRGRPAHRQAKPSTSHAQTFLAVFGGPSVSGYSTEDWSEGTVERLFHECALALVPPHPEAQLVEQKIRTWVSHLSAGVHAGTPSNVEVGTVTTQHAEQLGEVCKRLTRLENRLEEAINGIERLRTQNRKIWVPINTLAPEPYQLLQPVTAVVTTVGDEFEASFFDANLYGSGDTEEEAVSDLKAVIIEAFERLSALEDEKLGPAMMKQKLVLRAHVRRGEK
jgi:hypothetical protein